MSERTMYIIAITIGSVAGGFVPLIWGGSMMSFSSIFWSALGSIAALWAVYKLNH